MTRDELRNRAQILINVLRPMIEDLENFINSSQYDEDYKVQEWHTHLTERGFDMVEIFVREAADKFDRWLKKS